MRRQLQRQSRKNGQDHAPAPLPDDLLAAFTEEAATADLSIDHYPGHDEALEVLERLAAGGAGGLIALSGERGAGKTSWMMALERLVPEGVSHVRHEFTMRTIDDTVLCEHLCAVLGLDGPMTREQIKACLLAGPPG